MAPFPEISMQNLGRLSLLGKGASVKEVLQLAVASRLRDSDQHLPGKVVVLHQNEAGWAGDHTWNISLYTIIYHYNTYNTYIYTYIWLYMYIHNDIEWFFLLVAIMVIPTIVIVLLIVLILLLYTQHHQEASSDDSKTSKRPGRWTAWAGLVLSLGSSLWLT